MMVITESEVRVQCCGCTRDAAYLCTVKATPHMREYSRTYCEVHVAELMRRAATILENYGTGPLHDWIEVEHLMAGMAIHG